MFYVWETGAVLNLDKKRIVKLAWLYVPSPSPGQNPTRCPNDSFVADSNLALTLQASF